MQVVDAFEAGELATNTACTSCFVIIYGQAPQLHPRYTASCLEAFILVDWA